MYIEIEPNIDTEGILRQIEKVKKMSIELEEEVLKLRDAFMWPKFKEKRDSDESHNKVTSIVGLESMEKI